ncbi:conserved hypothetical protein [Candidatus Desulfarcum epimagneticum]|uniref:MGS-like domain-containing protein n=1 Tax=uncultured Desulfobacteraceae bacterium TaxID=218296 RepID=A0A484HHF0_9BACT|nr:conserved hypothetical protein [uncultured Desulfobacteraceae bacterium]
MTLNVVEKVDDLVKVDHALISVSDKTGLETFIPALMDIRPGIRFFSTGGTYERLRGIIGPGAEKNLIRVSDYTGQPETQGGLVKTLDFKIYLGLLTETYNDSHQEDLRRTDAVPIDMAVVNLYPFKEVSRRPGATLEEARGNIDIGGPCMIRAAAKNFIRVACVSDPGDYGAVVKEMAASQGRISLESRFNLAGKAFSHTASYEKAISDFWGRQTAEKMAGCYES